MVAGGNGDGAESGGFANNINSSSSSALKKKTLTTRVGYNDGGTVGPLDSSVSAA